MIVRLVRLIFRQLKRAGLWYWEYKDRGHWLITNAIGLGFIGGFVAVIFALAKLQAAKLFVFHGIPILMLGILVFMVIAAIWSCGYHVGDKKGSDDSRRMNEWEESLARHEKSRQIKRR